MTNKNEALKRKLKRMTPEQAKAFNDAVFSVEDESESVQSIVEELQGKAIDTQSAPTKTERSIYVAGFALLRVRTPQAEDMLRERIAFGEEKYGTLLHTFNGRDAVVDWLQEQLDGVQYLTQASLEGRRLSTEERSVALDLLGAQLQMIGAL